MRACRQAESLPADREPANPNASVVERDNGSALEFRLDHGQVGDQQSGLQARTPDDRPERGLPGPPGRVDVT